MKQLGTTTLLIAAMAGSTCAACSDGNVDIGEDNPQASKTGLAAYAGSWDGYVEAYKFEDFLPDAGTSDRVRLVIDEQGQGQIRFGARELFAKPTDPAVQFYPPQVEERQQQFPQVTPSIGLPGPFEGFNYPLKNSKVEVARIRTEASSSFIYLDYCSIQVADYPYRVFDQPLTDASTLQQWTVGYSKTPVTFAGWDILIGAERACLVFDQAPTTVEQLATNSMHSIPCSELSDLSAYNLAHPDAPVLIETRVNSMCSRNTDGTYTLAPEIAQISDIKLDGALENQANAIVGSLTVPGMEGEIFVRTVRLSRVQ